VDLHQVNRLERKTAVERQNAV